MDLDPFEPVGISARTMRFLDVFLLRCLLAESPPDTPEEIVADSHNQERIASRGREPGLMLQRGGRAVALSDWADEVMALAQPVAEALELAQPPAHRHEQQVGDPAPGRRRRMPPGTV